MSPTRFAYSTNAYTLHPLETAVREIADAGFQGVEILADAPHAFPGSCDPIALGRLIRETGLAVSNLNGNTNTGLDPDGRDPQGFWPSLIDPDPNQRRRRIDYVRGVIDLARAVGADTVCCASGRLPDGVSPGPAMDHLQAGFADILAHAGKESPVRVGIEYEPGFFLGDGPAVRRFIDDMNHPLLGANLDIGHAVCVGESVTEMVALFEDRIWNLHVEDIRNRVHDHLVPGLGDIDFHAFREALKKIGYEGFLTLELYPYKENPGEAGRKGLAHLRPIFD